VPLPSGSSTGDGESDFQRLNRNLNELLQELRISEVGVQILFAFLISLPFTARFGRVTEAEKIVYAVTLLLAVLASALMISPAAYHRIVFRHHRRDMLVAYASRVLLIGLTMLSLAMSGCIVLVTSFLFGSVFAAIAGGAVALWICIFWYVFPVRTRLRFEREEALHLRLTQHLHPHIPHPHIHHHDHHGYAGHDSHALHAHHATHLHHADHADHGDHADHAAGGSGGLHGQVDEDRTGEASNDQSTAPDPPSAQE
jgi:hypothetical protein